MTPSASARRCCRRPLSRVCSARSASASYCAPSVVFACSSSFCSEPRSPAIVFSSVRSACSACVSAASARVFRSSRRLISARASRSVGNGSFACCFSISSRVAFCAVCSSICFASACRISPLSASSFRSASGICCSRPAFRFARSVSAFTAASSTPAAACASAHAACIRW